MHDPTVEARRWWTQALDDRAFVRDMASEGRYFDTACFIAQQVGEKAKDILKWAFSYKESREILVIYERDTSTMSIYAMREVFRNLGTETKLTKKGSIAIGKSVVIQRKGGNGVHSLDIPKDSLKHPGNNVQVKLKMKEFISEMESILLASYHI